MRTQNAKLCLRCETTGEMDRKKERPIQHEETREVTWRWRPGGKRESVGKEGDEKHTRCGEAGREEGVDCAGRRGPVRDKEGAGHSHLAAAVLCEGQVGRKELSGDNHASTLCLQHLQKQGTDTPVVHVPPQVTKDATVSY